MVRMERRPYPTPESNVRLPERPSNLHRYIRAAEPSFIGKALIVPGDVHQMYLTWLHDLLVLYTRNGTNLL